MTKPDKITLPPEPPAAEPPRQNGWLTYVMEIAKNLVIAMLLYLLIDHFVLDRVRVENISMYPTLKEGEVLFVNKLAYKLGSVERGDIVTFHYPLEPTLSFIKRAIGLPGDAVEIKDKQVWVNGIILTEPYIVTPSDYTGQWVVPADSVFVLGDNRVDSADSHVWGFVPFNDLVGKAMAVYWPLDRFRLLTHPNLMSAASP
jgi:signal peptidase I